MNEKPRTEDYEDRTWNVERRNRLHDDLLKLERAVEEFLDGEIGKGLITSYKLTVVAAARTLRAVAQTSRNDLIDNLVDLG